MWMEHVSTTENYVSDGLSRGPNFHTQHDQFMKGTRLSEPPMLSDWIYSIVTIARSSHSLQRDTEPIPHIDIYEEHNVIFFLAQ